MGSAMRKLCAALAILVVAAPACTQIMGNDYTLLEPKHLGPCNPYTPGDCPADDTCGFDRCVKTCPENECDKNAWCYPYEHFCGIPMGTPCSKAGSSGCGATMHCIDRDRNDLPTAPYCTTHPDNIIPGQMCLAGLTPTGDSSSDCKYP